MSGRKKRPSDVWQHPQKGQRWFLKGRCVTCGDRKEHLEHYHCDACYEKLWPTMADYDDD